MAWDNPSELVVGGSGEIYVAPVGTALPANESSALNAAFVGLGLCSEDGVTLTVTPDVQEFRSWQRREPVRRELQGREARVSFALQQFDEDSVPLAFGGGSISTVSSGHYRYDLPDPAAGIDERALVADIVDGSTTWRIVCPRGNVMEAVETQFNRGTLSQLPIAFGALVPNDNSPTAYVLSNSAAFAAGS